MKIQRSIHTLLVALALGAFTVTARSAEDEKEEKVPFASLPVAVQKTILAQVGANSATLGEIEKDAEDGKTFYEAMLTLPSGMKLEVQVAEDGTLTKIDGGDEGEKGGGKGKDKDKDDDDDKKK